MKEENKPRQKMLMFNGSNVIGPKLEKLTSMQGKLTPQNRQSKLFKPRVYQGKGWPWDKFRKRSLIL